MRSDKRKDRVEVSPEQSAAAAAEAEISTFSSSLCLPPSLLFSLYPQLYPLTFIYKIGEKIGKRTRVVGWYHSHPHITVNPSHVGTLLVFLLPFARLFLLLFYC